MKLLAADYDGTIKSDIKNLYLNIIEINKFREKGNKFAIVTGRSYKSIKREIKKYDIKYDYLSCNGGLIVFDSNDNIVSETFLNKDVIDFIRNISLDDFNIEHLDFYNQYTTAKDFENILEAYIKFNNISSAKKFKQYIEEKFCNIKCNRNNSKIFIGEDITKREAVYQISQLENIHMKNIYTVGDASNDLEMLKAYNGYRVLYSYPSLWFKGIKVTPEVHTLVKKINRK